MDYKYSEIDFSDFSRSIVTNLIKIQHGEVHTAYNNKMVEKIYTIPTLAPDEVYYHLTHESADGVMKRHIRYWRGEANEVYTHLRNENLKLWEKKTENTK